MVIYTYEDRPACETGVRLLIASLCKHSPRIPIVLYFPPASTEFQHWAAQFSNVELRVRPIAQGLGWNVKPLVLLAALDDGHREVIWIDSDIIVTRPVEDLLGSLGPETFAMTEEVLWGRHDDTGAKRARAWRFPIGREMPFALNSCVIRMTDRHRALIERWHDLLNYEEYLNAQRVMLDDRPDHLATDQDVLCALLCSTDYSSVPLRILRRGEAILQIFGLKSYTIAERLQSIRHGVPTFVHSQQFKPWAYEYPVRGILDYLHCAYYDTSPYTLIAQRYRDQIGDERWLQPRTTFGRWLRILGFGSVPLIGLPLAVLFDTGYGMVRLLKDCNKRLVAGVVRIRTTLSEANPSKQ